MTTRLRLFLFLLLCGLATLRVPAEHSAAADAASARPRVPLGATTALLPDGRTLVAGGEGIARPHRRSAVFDADGYEERALRGRLHRRRAWHTATVLPDGRVLALGGIGADGTPIDAVETLAPDLRTWTTGPITGTPRAFHTTTLLTDGRVLVAGGRTDGDRSAGLEIWDPLTAQTSLLHAGGDIDRAGHTASLLPDGRVLLGGGEDQRGHARLDAMVFDPASGAVEPIAALPVLPATAGPQFVGSIPADGATGIALDGRIGLRFWPSLRPETATDATVQVLGPEGPVGADVVAAEGGALVFLTPRAPLQPATVYTVLVDGPTDAFGLAVPVTTIAFTTAGAAHAAGSPRHDRPETLPPQGEPHHIPEGEVWTPTPDNLRGDWRAGLPPSHWENVPPLLATPGVTALSGQILRVDGWPLGNVVVGLGTRWTKTDRVGRFLLPEVPAGRQTLVVDARPASTTKTSYGFFMIAVDVTPGETTVLSYTVWMPVLDTAHAVGLARPTTKAMVVTTPLIPGLEVHIPPGTILRKPDGGLAAEISITAIPIDRPPFPLPADRSVPVYFTLQPGGAVAEYPDGRPHPGLSLVFPNYTAVEAGSGIDYWSYDAGGKGWFTYGVGRVQAHGERIVPDSGVTIALLTCATIGDDDCPTCCEGDCCETGGDPVQLVTGQLLMSETDFSLADVLPVTLERSYHTGDNVARAFGLGTGHAYDTYVVGKARNDCSEVSVLLGGSGGQRVRFLRQAGTGCTDAVMYPYTAQPGAFFNATLTYVAARPGWDLGLRDGTRWEFAHDTTSEKTKLTAMGDRFGNRITILREDNTLGMRVKSITSPNGRWLDLTYGDPGYNRVTQVTDHMGRTASYTYDSLSRLTSVNVPDPNGGATPYTTTYAYDGTSARLQTVRSQGLNASCPTPCSQPPTLAVAYWPDGSVMQETLGDGVSTWQFNYNFVNGRSTSTDVTDPRGTVRRVTFNSAGAETGETLALGQPEQQLTTYTLQAGTNLVLSMTDALDRRTDYTHNAAGDVTSVTRLAGTGQAATTSFGYGVYSLLSTLTDPLGHTTAFTYGATGALQAITDPTGNTTAVSTNAAGQTTSITDALGKTTQFGYTAGLLTSTTNPLNQTTTRLLDAAGRLRRLTDPLGRATVYDHDTLDRLTRITDALGGATTFSYDPNGNLLSVQDARGSTTSYAYDATDHMVTRSDPLLRLETFDYDALGNLTSWFDRKGQETAYSYDRLNRRTFTGFNQMGAGYESALIATYDRGDRLTQLIDSANGTITQAYDGLDRLTTETSPQGTVSYAYDAAGRRQSMTIAGTPASAYTYAYDAADRPAQIAQGSTAVSLTYDVAGQRQTVTLPNGVVTTYTYDAASRLTAITGKKGATTVLDLAYGYDAAGSRTSVNGNSKRTSIPQPVAAASYDAANQLTQWAGAAHTYDANGNLTSDGATTYTWNARNQLTAMSGPGLSASFAYDGVGRRRSRTVNGTTTTFLWDELNRVRTTTGTTDSHMLQGLGLDENFARIDGTTVTSFLTDALGSTYTLTDGTSAVTAQYSYEPYGVSTRTSGTAATDLLFTGREDDATSLLYYRARYYARDRGRFVAEDPLFQGAGLLFPLGSTTTSNADPIVPPVVGSQERSLFPRTLETVDRNGYGYALSSPTNLTDPLGLSPACGGNPGAFSRCVRACTRGAQAWFAYCRALPAPGNIKALCWGACLPGGGGCVGYCWARYGC